MADRRTTAVAGLCLIAGAWSCAPGPSAPVTGDAPMERDPARHAAPLFAPTVPDGRRVQVAEYSPARNMESGCYNIGDQRVKFKVYIVTSDDRAAWNRLADNTPSTCDTTHKWDDTWYWYALPHDEIKNMMLMWMNINSNQYGYVVVRISPDRDVQVYDNDSGPERVPNDKTRGFSWNSNGYLIRIQVKNPPHRYPWRPNDFQFRFVR